MPKRPTKKVKEAPKKKEEVNTSDEELLEAANVLEKDQEDKKKKEEEEAPSVTSEIVTADKPTNMTSIDSDEELLQAALELEHLQLAGHEQEGAPSRRWPTGCPTSRSRRPGSRACAQPEDFPKDDEKSGPKGGRESNIARLRMDRVAKVKLEMSTTVCRMEERVHILTKQKEQ